ncbi:hypothetical protein ABEB36_002831 [Hypothenemus hampei]|uniref:C2H2-type domain-containing protein n=1 Tax=Hypothenemus hampei TaxID=57062 RepID=A0ABD1FA86_HYPHA
MVAAMEVHRTSSSDLFPVSHPNFTDSLGVISEWIPPIPVFFHPKITTCNGDSELIKTGPSNASEYSKLLIPGRVMASAPIPQGAMTIHIDALKLLGKVDIQQVSVGVTSFGTLDLDKKSKNAWNQKVHWVRAIRLSDDCHTYNVQLKFQPSYRFYATTRGGPQPKLILQAVRSIEIGQELQLWFSEEILAMLQVVFLNPLNIQGENKYTCLKCSTLFESPNPLKLHITLLCGKLPIFTLWERLATLLTEPQSIRQATTKIKDFEFKLTSDPTQLFKQRNPLDLTVTTSSENVNGSAHKSYTDSAFKPFSRKHSVSNEINSNSAGFNQSVSSEVPAIWPVTFEADVVQLHRNLMQNQALTNAQNMYNDDAHIESLVSSLGKAKQGHICLYCGKCYSRKYGLKIHIRTHTGYKPLRCKFCDRPFGDPSNLNKHVRLHAEGNTPYKCDLCGKILVRRRDLERHLKSRHMLEMHPGKTLLPDSPVSTNDNSSSLTDDNDNTHVADDSSATYEDTIESLGEKTQSETTHMDDDITIIDVEKDI